MYWGGREKRRFCVWFLQFTCQNADEDEEKKETIYKKKTSKHYRFRVLDVRYKKNKIYNIGWSSIQIELCMYVLHIFDKNLLKIKIHLNT